MNNGLNDFITYNDSTNNKVSLNYNMYADGYSKSKTLNFNFSKILIREVDEKNTILTDEIYKKPFDLSTKQYKNLKGIENTKRNLRNNMDKSERNYIL